MSIKLRLGGGYSLGSRADPAKGSKDQWPKPAKGCFWKILFKDRPNRQLADWNENWS